MEEVLSRYSGDKGIDRLYMKKHIRLPGTGDHPRRVPFHLHLDKMKFIICKTLLDCEVQHG